MTQLYKHYNFLCSDCNKQFKVGAWLKDGILSIPSCSFCQSINVIVDEDTKKYQSGPMINTREDWKKKIPTQHKEFMSEFKKRHGKNTTLE